MLLLLPLLNEFFTLIPLGCYTAIAGGASGDGDRCQGVVFDAKAAAILVISPHCRCRRLNSRCQSDDCHFPYK